MTDQHAEGHDGPAAQSRDADTEALEYIFDLLAEYPEELVEAQEGLDEAFEPLGAVRGADEPGDVPAPRLQSDLVSNRIDLKPEVPRSSQPSAGHEEPGDVG
ncbi:hypothetical protein [Kitasatospora sp. NPDC004289]